MSNFIVGQVGSRNFNVALLLHKERLLDQLIVDTFFSRQSYWAKIPILGNKLAVKLRKYDIDLPLNSVSYDWLGALTMRYLQRQSNISAFNYANKRLNKRIINYANNKTPGSYYGFDTSSMEFLKWGAPRGWNGYLEQCVAPRSSQIAMWNLLADKYGINADIHIEQALIQQERERIEWEYAKKIIVPSEYVKGELLKDGKLEANKIEIVNYGYTAAKDHAFIKQSIERKQEFDGEIRVLFAGNGGYRKGIADLVKLAEMLKGENIKFLIAGKLEDEAKDIIDKYPYSNLNYLGKLSREQLADEYLKADLFFFPSYLEGSAMVLLEAMSWGLPIVTTYQSGSVVEEGFNGFLSDAGNLDNLRDSVLKLAHNKDLRFTMGMASLDASVRYSVNEYGRRLLNVLTEKS